MLNVARIAPRTETAELNQAIRLAQTEGIDDEVVFDAAIAFVQLHTGLAANRAIRALARHLDTKGAGPIYEY